MILVLVLAIHNMIWHIKILHNLTSHDSIWHNVMILVSIQQHNMIWHIKILHNAQVSQSLEQKSDSFTDKSFRAHTRRTMHTTIGEGDETRPHICHIYHRLYLWRKFCHVEKFQISVKNLNNLWRFIKIYAVFVINLRGEKSLWRKKWQIWGLDETHIGVHIQQSNTHTKSVTQCTRRYNRAIAQGVEITATQGTEVNICTKSQKATRSRIKRGSATASKGELGEITGRRWGGNFRLKTGKQSTIKACS